MFQRKSNPLPIFHESWLLIKESSSIYVHNLRSSLAVLYSSTGKQTSKGVKLKTFLIAKFTFFTEHNVHWRKLNQLILNYNKLFSYNNSQ